MSACPTCQQPPTERHGRDRTGRQRYSCRPSRRTFTAQSISAFSGYRWPAEVVLMAVRWYLRHPLSGASVMELLAERGVDVSKRTVLRWVQTFGRLLAAEARKHHRRPGGKWYVDDVFFVRKSEKRYLYRALTSTGRYSTYSWAITVTVRRLRRSSNGRWALLASSPTRSSQIITSRTSKPWQQAARLPSTRGLGYTGQGARPPSPSSAAMCPHAIDCAPHAG